MQTEISREEKIQELADSKILQMELGDVIDEFTAVLAERYSKLSDAKLDEKHRRLTLGLHF